ncbi:MAG: hypothetical protein RL095_219 [Verrucomicrobiota bacterium]|jgi:signal transduction histidine kinase
MGPTSTAYLVCFFEMNFAALGLLTLHSLRRQLGPAPFLAFAGALFLACQAASMAGLRLDPTNGPALLVGPAVLATPFLAALLAVYALEGVLAAQRLVLAALVVGTAALLLTAVTTAQINSPAFLDVPPGLAAMLEQGRMEIPASLAAMITDLIILPITFQLFRNRGQGIFVSVLAAMIFTLVLDTWIYGTVLSWGGLETEGQFWDNLRSLFVARALGATWLALMVTIYLRLEGLDGDGQGSRNPMDFLKAILNSYSPSSIVGSNLQDWDDRFRLLVENSQDLILLVDQGGKIRDANKITLETCGRPLDRVCGQPFSRLLIPAHDSSLPPWMQAIAAAAPSWSALTENLAFKPGQPQSALLVFKGRQGPRAIEFLVSDVLAGDSRLILLGGRDETSRLRLLAEREQLYEQLGHSQRLEAVGRLAGGIAHDFNNLLHMMQGAADSLDRCQPERRAESLQLLQAALGRASRLVGQLLGFARKGRFNVSRSDLAELLRNCSVLFEPATRKAVQLRSILHPEPLDINADTAQIEQVVMNLLINARDALEGRPEPRIVLRCEPATQHHPGWSSATPGSLAEHFAVIRIRDNGCGIPPEHLSRIFEPFFTTKEVGKGTGMGLAMAWGVIKAHHGWMHVESLPGTGTEFFIYLPLAGTPEGEKPISASPVLGETQE